MLAEVLRRDQTSIIGWHSATNATTILTGYGNYEDGDVVGPAVRAYSLPTGSVDDDLTTTDSSAGPMAVSDVRGDGILELFIGGRAMAGRYPEPASSRLLRLEAGKWQPDPQNSSLFTKVGLVSGAIFSDLQTNGFADLVLSCEWGAIRIFHNEKGRLKEWDPPISWPDAAGASSRPNRLSQLTGWWNSVSAGDSRRGRSLGPRGRKLGAQHQVRSFSVPPVIDVLRGPGRGWHGANGRGTL